MNPPKPSLKRSTIVVIRGGRSSEREISLQTGKNVEDALRARGHDVTGMDLGPELFDRLSKKDLDLAFIALHGKWGEDGTLQGMLEIFGVPYTGSGVLASALAMDKISAKRILRSFDLPTPDWTEYEWNGSRPAMEFPLVVKPSRGGSTVGVSIAATEKDLDGSLERALAHDRRVLLETYIPGKELTVGVIGLDPQALPVVEIRAKGGFSDYESKYTEGMEEYLIPAPLSEKVYERAQELAVKAHAAIGCRGYSRVDIRCDYDEKSGEGNLQILEVNTIPGMTRLSLLPMAAKAAGISFEDLAELMAEWGMTA